MSALLVLLFWAALAVSMLSTRGVSLEPRFGEPIVNVTVPIDRRATLSCTVDNLEGHRVAWIKVDTQTILAIHTNVVTQNSRISTSHNGLRTWNLHIDNVKEVDRGEYMCQINTAPMKKQVGYIEVVVPPDILYDETSPDVSVKEGDGVSLTCRATGYPKPTITWRREDNELIVLRKTQPHKHRGQGGHSKKTKEKIRVHSIEADTLNISRVHRRHMGVYLCIASNGIPPSVSKRVKLQVNFQPIIKVPNQMVAAPVGAEVTLECHVEVSPTRTNYWKRNLTDGVLLPGSKYDVAEVENGGFKVTMRLTILSVETVDFDSYTCASENSLGAAQSSIRLRELDLPSSPNNIKLEVEDKISGHHFAASNNSHSSHKSHESIENVLVFGMNQSFQGRKYDVSHPSRNSSGVAKDLLDNGSADLALPPTSDATDSSVVSCCVLFLLCLVRWLL